MTLPAVGVTPRGNFGDVFLSGGGSLASWLSLYRAYSLHSFCTQFIHLVKQKAEAALRDCAIDVVEERVLDIVIAGVQDDRNFRIKRAQPLRQLTALHPGHHVVDDCHRAAGLPEELERSLAVGRCQNSESPASQQNLYHSQELCAVIYAEYDLCFFLHRGEALNI